MAVKIIVNNIFSRIYGDLEPTVIFSIWQHLHYTIKDAYYRIDENSEWDGEIPLYWPDQGHKFYTGMMSYVREILKNSGVSYTIEDRRICPEPNLPENVFCPKEPMEERDYQDFTVERCFKATRGILQAATGAGKTFMVTKLIGRIRSSPFLFLVLSKDLLYQAKECLENCLNASIGMVGDGNMEIGDITVMTVQTAIRAIHSQDKAIDLNKYRYDEEDVWEDDVADESEENAKKIRQLITDCKGVYFDEVHHAAAKTCQEVLEHSKNAYWRFGGSATPFREDGAEKMIQALFGSKQVEISASWLIKHGYLVKPYIFNIIVPGETKYLRYQSIYKDRISDNPFLHDLVANIDNHLQSRKIPFLTLVQQYKHGDNIKSRNTEIPFIKGNLSRTRRQNMIKDLKDGSIPGAIATTLADEGLDVKRLGAVLIPGGGKSITRFYQRVGRTLRLFPGKERALVFLFHHQCRYLKNHGNKVRKLLAAEPEFSVFDFTPDNILTAVDDLVCPGGGLFD